MKRLQAYKFQIMPSGEQQRYMRRIVGSCRYVWNKALALQIANHEAGEKFTNHFVMCKWLPVWKKEPETLWLKETPSQLYQVVLKDLARAYKNFSLCPSLALMQVLRRSLRFPKKCSKVGEVSARLESQNKVQQQLEKTETKNNTIASTDCPYSE